MKNILITGASTGIGLAIAKTILEHEEYSVISISRNRYKKVFDDDRMKYFFADISDVNELMNIREEIVEKYGVLDAIINNAGTIIPGGIESLSFEEWNRSLNSNLSGYFNVTKVFLDMLKKSQANPCVINISSISAKLGGSSVAYSVAKAGVNMLTQVEARELSKYGIRVNSVSPGIVNSGFQVANGVTEQEAYDDFLKNQSQVYPLGIGDVTEIANAVWFLLTDKSAWITGANITVDGGRSIMV